ncbi:MAG: DNA polymerase [Actinomycetota bacterium]|nr:DNA polymerase [Actinomycetota bacterium]
MTIYHVRGAISSEATLLRRFLCMNERLGFAVETSPTTGRLLSWQIAGPTDEFVVDASIWPLREASIRSVLEDRRRTKLIYNGQQLAGLVARYGVILAGVCDGLAVARLLLAGLEPAHFVDLGLGGLELGELVRVLLDEGDCVDPLLISGRHGRLNASEAHAAALHVRHVRRVGEPLLAQAELAGLERAARLESAVALVFGRMEPDGLRIDRRRWRELCGGGFDAAVVAERTLCDALGVVQDHSGRYVGFNASSPQDVAGRLSEHIGTAISSTAAKAFESIAHPEIAALQAYRSGRNLAQWAAVPRDGALRPSWSVLGTVTGRVTSHDPNVQGMPHELREAVVAKDGLLFGSFDYGRQELYVLAAVSGDGALTDDLARGDPYERIATAVGVERGVAKRALLSVSYGSQASGLAEACGITVETARVLRRSLQATYPQAMTFGSRVRIEAAPDAGTGLLVRADGVGEVRTRHRRRLVRRHGSSRLSVANTPIQATAADMVKEALVTVERDLREQIPHARIVGTIHDEILVAAPADSTDRARDVVQSAMTRAGERCLHFPSPPVAGGFAECWAAATHSAQ